MTLLLLLLLLAAGARLTERGWVESNMRIYYEDYEDRDQVIHFYGHRNM
jgi:hypothetical protein